MEVILIAIAMTGAVVLWAMAYAFAAEAARLRAEVAKLRRELEGRAE